MCNIENFYSDSKFENIVFYLKENGILSVKELINFNFEKLWYVPGILPEVIVDAQNMYTFYLESGSKIINRNVTEPSSDNNINISHEDLIYTPPITTKKESTITLDNIAGIKEDVCCTSDALIEDVYSGIPRNLAFVNWCKANEKTLMSQITVDDFDKAKTLKGLGVSSAERLLDVYHKFYGGEGICLSKDSFNFVHLSDKTLTEVLIEDVFSSFPHGEQLIRHCHTQGIKTIADMQNFSFDYKEIKGIGIASMQKLQQVYLDVVMSLSTETYVEADRFYNIPQVNRSIPLKNEYLNNNNYFYLEDICQRGLPLDLYIHVKETIEKYYTPIGDIFAEKVDSLKESVHVCFIRRVKGDTLQKIADSLNISRERVRQVVLKAVQELANYSNIIASVLLFPNKTSFAYSNIEALFSNSIHAESCKYVLRECSDVIYLDFADKFIKKSMTYNDYDMALHRFATDVVGDGIYFYESLENIEAQLPEYGLDDLGFEDIMNYLVKIGYHFYGDYVIKGKQSYGVICHDAIEKYFPNGIKLDSDQTNEDMLKLRQIISQRYNGLDLPDNNRALTARITPLLVLSGRGQYTTIKSVIYDRDLFTEIYNYILNSPHESLYYHEVFAKFQGRLLAETSISNINFLHGMLKYLYPNGFTYQRDLLIKNGASRQNIDSRICELIISKQKPLSRTEIKSEISGLNDFVISFSIMREPKLIQWDYNMFNHIHNISIYAFELSTISELLKNEVANWGGYLSDELLFNAVKRTLPEFIRRNNITNSLNMYYIIAFYFDKEYRFRRPHIITHYFPVDELTVLSVTKAILNCTTKINYTEYVQLSEKLCWASGTFYSVFSELEKEYVRISENDYISRNTFVIPPDVLSALCMKLSHLTQTSDYFALSSIFDFTCFPPSDYEWNGFLVETIISELDTGFKILAPQIKDRRYQRGIIVPINYPAFSFEQLVVNIMQHDNITTLSEAEMLNYLKNKGIISKIIPQELYDSPLLAFKNQMFRLINKFFLD